jgi:ribosomal protein S18 acetylase RimI-like enzyme
VTPPDVTLRGFDPQADDVASITRLLHRAYAPLAARGWNYTASYQSGEVTLRRLASGTGLVGLLGDRIVATITVYGATPFPGSPELYRDGGTAFFGPFAVDPELQRRGIGARLVGMAESIARADGKSRIACDTAEPAEHLIAFYRSLGYEIAELVRWPGKTYRSVVMAKALR